ncbi:20468_t:CDS:2, partial [Cetraspora pellucida]
ECGVDKPPKPTTIVGYYPAYKYNFKPDDLNISSSITHLNYIAFGPNDLINVTTPSTVFQQHYLKFNQFRDYLIRNPNRKFQVILSVLLPTSQDLVKISPFSNVGIGQYNQNNNVVNDLVKIVTDNSFDGIDIDYPNKLPCYPSQGTQGQNVNTNNLNPVFISFIADISSKLKQSNSSKILTVTAGQYPIYGLNSSISDIISFVNIQAFYLNIGKKSASAGINDIQKIFDTWDSYVSKSKLVLGIDFGGIVEVVTSSNIVWDTNNQNLQVVNVTTTQFSFADETIQDPCGLSVYASWSWKNLSTNLLSPCYTSINKNSQWTFHSLKYKLDYVQQQNALGIAIFDITKDTVDATLMNFIIGNSNSTSQKPNTPTSQPFPTNLGAIVGGVIGSIIFVSVIMVAGFILYRRKYSAGMPGLLVDTNNQACSDTNRHVYSDINCQVRSDTYNRIYSDTNHKDCGVDKPQQLNTIVGYYPAYKYNLAANDFNISSSITHLNYIAFGPNDLTNGIAPFTAFTDQQHYIKFQQFRQYLVGYPNRTFQ